MLLRLLSGARPALGSLATLAALLGPTAAGAAGPVRAAYFYNYMSADHLDSLRAAGFNRAVIHWITDSLGTAGTGELARFATRGAAIGVEVAPEFAVQARARLAGRPAARRYTWGAAAHVESDVACPLDSLYWRSALLDRANEYLAARGDLTRLVVDLELYGSSSRHHYDAGPCLCASCLAEYANGRPLDGRDPSQLAGLTSFEEARLTHILSGLLAEFAAAHPGVEIGAFDLDFNSFAHRAFARGLAAAAVPSADYAESTYSAGGACLPRLRARLDGLGLKAAPLIGGIWLKRFTPEALGPAIRSITDLAPGYFVFTTFSLWQDPAKLSGPYTLLGSRADYWQALARANAP